MHDLSDQERHAEIMGMDEREEGLDRLGAGGGGRKRQACFMRGED